MMSDDPLSKMHKYPKPDHQSTIWSLDCGQYTMEVSVIFPSNQFSKKLYVYVNCFQMWPVTLALLSYLAVSSAFTSPFGIMSSSVGESRACPVPMNNFDLSQVRPVTIKKSLSAISRIFSTFQQFLGQWYILEYQYAEEASLNSVDCLGFKFTLDDIPLGPEMNVMTANFTFRFPPKTGFSYNVPTYAFLSDNKAKWTTTLKNDGKFSILFMPQ